jgi:hypothetical protein
VLQRAYPKKVFRDVTEMEGGLDFKRQLTFQLNTCHAALVVIGPAWLTLTDSNGRALIQNEHDDVRTEIETVLSRELLRVFPLLVKGASMPDESAIPKDLVPLLRRHGYPTRSDPDFNIDMDRLIAALDVTLGITRRNHRPRDPLTVSRRIFRGGVITTFVSRTDFTACLGNP